LNEDDDLKDDAFWLCIRRPDMMDDDDADDGEDATADFLFEKDFLLFSEL